MPALITNIKLPCSFGTVSPVLAVQDCGLLKPSSFWVLGFLCKRWAVLPMCLCTDSLIYFKAAALEESITVILQGENFFVLFCYLSAILSLDTSVFLTKPISLTLHISVAVSLLAFLSPSGYSAMNLTGFFPPLSTHIYKPIYISLPDIPT